MADNTNKLAIVLLTRNRLEIFDLSQKKVFPFNLPPAIFRDLEIINKNELETQMSLFINFYKIKPVPIVILLANDVCFELEIPETQESAIESKINNFLYYLPFEEPIHKIYKLNRGFYLSAVNREMIDVFKLIFKKLGFYTEAIVPSSIAGINVKTIDAPSADFIMAKLNVIKNQTLVSPEPLYQEKKVEEKKVLGVNRVFILLSVFLVLLIALLLVLYQQSVANRKISSNRKFSNLNLVLSAGNTSSSLDKNFRL